LPLDDEIKVPSPKTSRCASFWAKCFPCCRAQPEEHKPWPYLLPARAEADRHKRTLVLDLDETLVHSSFKVCSRGALSFARCR
jgi:hypothetical protein